MGNCCGTDVPKSEAETEADFGAAKPAANAAPAATSGIISGTFYPELLKGCNVMVVPQSKTGIMCTLFYQPEQKRFVLKRDSLSRIIPLEAVQRVLSRVQDLKRVEGAASSLATDENCCALLLKSQSCIGLRFQTKVQRDQFASTVSELVLHYYQ